MSLFRGIKRDLSFMKRLVSFGVHNLPSLRDKRKILQQFGQAKFSHGVDIGMRRAMNYHPGSDNGVLRNDWSTTVKSATSIIREDFTTICARAELAYRTDAIARRAVNILGHFIVGQGNQPYPSVQMSNGEPVEGVNGQLAADWERFNDEGVRNGTMHLTMYQAQLLKFITMVVYGSVLQNRIRSKTGSLLPYAFQILKPTRLDFMKDTYIYSTYDEVSNQVIHGMKLNGYGEPLAYYFQGENTARSASNIDLTFYPIETEQYLGISWLTPVLPAIYDRQQLIYDKLKQSRIGAKLGMQMPKEMKEGVDGLTETDDGTGETFFDLEFQGFVFSDKDIKPVSITDPIEKTFERLIKMAMQEIALGMGFSNQKLTSDLENTNFTSGRINTIDDNKFFRVLFKHFVKGSCQLDWNRFVEWEALTGRLQRYGVGYAQYLNEPWRYSQCYWLPKDGEDWVDPLKDAMAMVLLYKTGQMTYQEICSRAGKNYKAVMKQLKREREEMKEGGLEYMLPERISATAKVTDTDEKEGKTESVEIGADDENSQ